MTNYQRKKYQTLTWAVDVRLFVLPHILEAKAKGFRRDDFDEEAFWKKSLVRKCKKYGLLTWLYMPLETRYYYVDECDDYAVTPYESEKDFWEGMLWNREIAKEYGDEVPTIKSIKQDFMHPIADARFNGAYFLKLTGITPDEYFDYGYSYAKGASL